MAISRVQGGSATGVYNGSTATNASVTLTAIGSGNTVAGGFASSFGVPLTVLSITDDKGNTYNAETAVVNGTSFEMVAFSLNNITNGPVTITASVSGNTNLTLIVDEFSGTGIASTDQRDGAAHGGQFQASPGTGANGVTSGSFTTSTNGDLLYSITTNNTATGNATLTPGSTTNATYSAGTTSTFTAFSNLQMNSAWAVQSTAGASTAATWTQSQNDPRETILIAIKPAAGGGAVVAGGTMSMMGVG